MDSLQPDGKYKKSKIKYRKQNIQGEIVHGKLTYVMEVIMFSVTKRKRQGEEILQTTIFSDGVPRIVDDNKCVCPYKTI